MDNFCRLNMVLSAFLALMLGLVSFQVRASDQGFRAQGETRVDLEMPLRTSEGKIYSSRLRLSYTEILSAGVLVIYNPTLFVMPFAPTSMRSFDLHLTAEKETAQQLCQMMGFVAVLEGETRSREFFATKDGVSVIRKSKSGYQFQQKLYETGGNGRRAQKVSSITRIVCSR
jgi:hypothetical protein